MQSTVVFTAAYLSDSLGSWPGFDWVHCHPESVYAGGPPPQKHTENYMPGAAATSHSPLQWAPHTVWPGYLVTNLNAMPGYPITCFTSQIATLQPGCSQEWDAHCGATGHRNTAFHGLQVTCAQWQQLSYCTWSLLTVRRSCCRITVTTWHLPPGRQSYSFA